MRTLLIGALAATLVGCSCPLPRQASMDACTDANGFACFDRTAASQPIEPKPASFNANSGTIKVKSAIAKTEKPSPAGASDKAVHLDAKKAKPTMIAAKVEPPASGQPAATSDPVIIKAKAVGPWFDASAPADVPRRRQSVTSLAGNHDFPAPPG